MAIQPSNYFGGPDPYAGASQTVEGAFSNVGQALFGDPRQAGQRGLRTAQARVAGTEADLNEQKIEKNRRSLDAQGVIGKAFSDALTFTAPDGSTRPATQAEVLPKLGPLFQNLADTTGASPDQIGGLFRAFTGATGDERLSRSGFVAAGGAPNENYAATGGRADEVHARNAKSDKDRATAVAGIGAGATLGAARIREQGETGRQASRLEWDKANPTFDRFRATTGGLFVDGAPDDVTRTARQRDIVAPGVVSAEERAGAVRDAAGIRGASGERVAETNAGAKVDAAKIGAEGRVAAATAGAKPAPRKAVNEMVERQITAEMDSVMNESEFTLTDSAASSVRARATELYQENGGNPIAATRQALKEFSDTNPQDSRSGLGGLFRYLGRQGPRFDAPPAVGAAPARPAGQTSVMPQAPAASGPPPGAVDALRKNPGLAPQFDLKYGPGSAARALGGA